MKISKWLFVILAVVALTGCSSKFFTYKGATLTQENYIVELEQGEQQGVWKTNELAINYRYHLTPESLKISGVVNLIGGFAIGFNSVDRLVVQLLFSDNQGVVIDNVNIYAADHRHSIQFIPMSFEAVVPVPPNTTAISFAYDGRLSDGAGTLEGTSVDIWYFPS